MTTEYPILEYDADPVGIIDPTMISRRNVPEHAVLCFFGEVVARLAAGARECFTLRAEHGTHTAYETTYEGRRLAFFQPGVGAPLAAAFLEQAIARGCRRFAVCGGAGALVPELVLGHVIVPTAAVRDEGTSYHYLPPAREVTAEPTAVTAATSVLSERGVPFVASKTWTTDAIYRETRARGPPARGGVPRRGDGGGRAARGRALPQRPARLPAVCRRFARWRHLGGAGLAAP